MADAIPTLGAETTVESGTSVDEIALRTAGGLSCNYQGNEYSFTLIALPSATASSIASTTYADPSCIAEYLRSFCFTTRDVAGTWILAGVHVPPNPDGSPVSANPVDLQPLIDVVARNAETQEPPVRSEPTTDWWVVVPCLELSPLLSIDEVFGIADVEVEDGNLWPPSVASRVASEVGALQECSWNVAGTASVTVSMVPGAGAYWEQLATAARATTDIEIDGAVSARESEDVDGRYDIEGRHVVLTDGTNTAVVSGYGVDLDVVASRLVTNG